jgi:hypothetical protein
MQGPQVGMGARLNAVSWFCQAYLTSHLTTRAEIRLTRRWIGDRGLGTRQDLKDSNFRILPYCPCTHDYHSSCPCLLHNLQSWPLFLIQWLVSACCLLIFTIMPVAVIRSASSSCRRKDLSCQFFEPLDSMQECSEPLF